MAVRAPAVAGSHADPVQRRAAKFAGLAPASRSPATKLSVTSQLVKPVPTFCRVHQRFAVREGSRSDVATCGWSPAVVETTMLPLAVAVPAKSTATGA